ncbi:N-6 DNA methylase [Actinomadura sp. 7K507]|uniref:HsdM family class I SAM-dependent methyltransferase n=1 Tax=Actinomadura sp. 7K507 TaxID=2530365 RepID=UPI001042ACC3|nr:N-6 DNA methylase [Actinomadura sp. 7K507]TDC96135.1 SAM-dependent DNA methyltransferase [Actinomadura sp. 7K507]
MTDARQTFDSLWSFYGRRLSAESVSGFEFVEQITYLLFLKIDHERASRQVNPVRVVPRGLDWPSLTSKSGRDLEQQYARILSQCGIPDPAAPPSELTMRTVFRKAVSSIRNPAALAALIQDEIGSRSWSGLIPAVTGELYDLLLYEASAQFNIEAGQTLTPPPFVSAVVDCIRPSAADRVFDPACGTGSLLVRTHAAMASEQTRLADDSIIGVDLDERMCRLATMSLLLHTGLPFSDPPSIWVADSLAAPASVEPTVVICNPPFRSTAPAPRGRIDLIASTRNIQLNFLQHIAKMLPTGARAAVFVPDNVLFASGSAKTVRSWLFYHCNLHTLLRLPTGVFERGGVKTNVLFFDMVGPKNDGSPTTGRLDVYDFRTGKHFQAKHAPLTRRDLDPFVEWYESDRKQPTDGQGEKRYRSFTYAELAARDLNIDITWLREEAVEEEFLSPRLIAREIADELTSAAQEFTALAEALPDAPTQAEGGGA